MEELKRIITASLTLLFPPACPCCKRRIEDNYQPLCGNCFAQLKFIKTPYCVCCGRVFSGDGENHLCGICLKSSWVFDKARSLFSYEDIIARLIHDLKYSGKTTGLDALKWISEHSTVLSDLETPDIIIPVPLHTKRLRKRGFNQAAVLANTLFSEEKNRIRHNTLIRKVDTPAQAGLNGQERRKNLKNVFMVAKPSEVADKNILILDDVFTTGSTTQECAKALKAAGCKKVEVLTVCRADKFIS